MGTKYHSYFPSNGHFDPETAYEITNGKITTYDAKDTSWFFSSKRKFEYTLRSQFLLKQVSQIGELYMDDGGSGSFDVTTGNLKETFYVHSRAQQFAREIQHTIDRSPS